MTLGPSLDSCIRPQPGAKFPVTVDDIFSVPNMTITPPLLFEPGSSVVTIGSFFARNIEEALAGVDLLLTASSMDPACRIDDEEAVEITYPRQARTPFNVTGHPALTLMCGLSEPAGLPLALQLVGRVFGEATIYRAAAAYERAAPWKDFRPAL